MSRRPQRRALSDLIRDVRLGRCEPGHEAVLARVLDVPADADVRAFTHGFHDWPAKLHPLVARRLIAAYARAGDTVLDPFCGSGTVLVEAALRGCRAIGVDVNPLAVRLARLKSSSWGPAAIRRLVDATDRVARGLPPGRLTAEQEAEALAAEARRVPDADVREALVLSLSSLAFKLQRRPGDRDAPARGWVARLLVDRVAELRAGLRALRERIPAGTPPARIERGDARALSFVADRTAQLVVTSPPYAGVYDYAARQSLRAAWLGEDFAEAARGEIGSRASFSRDSTAPEAYRDDLAAALREMRRVLVADGVAAVVIGDSEAAGRLWRADATIADAAARAGMRAIASASWPRPPSAPRGARAQGARLSEHLVVLKEAR